jgi:hypothetical protein
VLAVWFLAAGFTVENNMVLVELAAAFGTTDRKQGGPTFTAKEDYLRAESTGVERRLEGAKAIIRRVLGADEGDAVVQDLAEYRRLRHLCAHRPCWLEGIWDPDAGIEDKGKGIPKGRTVSFRLFIADASYIWEVDDEQIAEWAALLNRTADAGPDTSGRNTLLVGSTTMGSIAPKSAMPRGIQQAGEFEPQSAGWPEGEDYAVQPIPRRPASGGTV